jgi:GT2 family glycosyltransferase
MRIAVLMTCFNRRETTLACLQALLEADLPRSIVLSVLLVDDASTDGTATAVRGRFPRVEIVCGDGTLFWNRGMHLAQELAMRAAPDFVLWLNDDTVIRKDALTRMFATFLQLSLNVKVPAIVVGATADPATGKITYAGMTPVSRLRPFRYRRVWHPDEVRECHAMNGNLVLIPRIIVERLENLDAVFEHAMGDIDYALRARRAGFRIFVAPGVMGFCSHNTVMRTGADPRLSLAIRWKRFTSRKGLPLRSWLHFTRRHGAAAWPLFFLWPYVRFLVRAILGRG